MDGMSVYWTRSYEIMRDAIIYRRFSVELALMPKEWTFEIIPNDRVPNDIKQFCFREGGSICQESRLSNPRVGKVQSA